ncbi:MAG: hypothetical protein K6U04_11450 [Armatimonadetes bacterium]|nr:hypothetical protein [Armatimonadota bacterium]
MKRRHLISLLFFLGIFLTLGAGMPGRITAAAAPAGGSGLMSIDVRNADLRDVLSLIALKMEVNILYCGGSAGPVTPGDKESKPVPTAQQGTGRITLKLDNVTPQQMLDLVVQSQGLAYLRDGHIIVVGPRETLNESFIKQVIPVYFDLSFISAAKFKEVADGLKLTEKCLVIDENSVVIQDVPLVLEKVRQVLAALDVPENGERFDYRLYELKEIAPAKAKKILETVTDVEATYVEAGDRLLAVGKPAMLDRVGVLLKEIDVSSGRAERLFIYRLSNNYAQAVASRLKELIPEGVVVSLPPYPEFARTLLIKCLPEQEKPVREALSLLDSKGEEITAAFRLVTDADPWGVRNLVADVTGVSIGNMKVYSLGIETESGETKVYVLYVHDTPERIKKVEKLLGDVGLKS